MAQKFIDIEQVPQGYDNRVKQDLKFKTAKFIWRVRFTTALDPRTVNSGTMYVTDELGNKLSTSIRYDDSENQIEVEPLEPYAENLSYFLNITTQVRSRGGQYLKEPVQIKFKL